MRRPTGAATSKSYFTMTMEGAFITKVSNSGTEEGNVIQKVAMVFKTVTIDYQPQDAKTGKLARPRPSTGTSRPAPPRRRVELHWTQKRRQPFEEP